METGNRLEAGSGRNREGVMARRDVMETKGASKGRAEAGQDEVRHWGKREGGQESGGRSRYTATGVVDRLAGLAC